MPTFGRFVVWFFERALELMLAYCMLLLIYGPSHSVRFPGILGQLYLGAIAIMFFDIATG